MGLDLNPEHLFQPAGLLFVGDDLELPPAPCRREVVGVHQDEGGIGVLELAAKARFPPVSPRNGFVGPDFSFTEQQSLEMLAQQQHLRAYGVGVADE